MTDGSHVDIIHRENIIINTTDSAVTCVLPKKRIQLWIESRWSFAVTSRCRGSQKNSMVYYNINLEEQIYTVRQYSWLLRFQFFLYLLIITLCCKAKTSPRPLWYQALQSYEILQYSCKSFEKYNWQFNMISGNEIVKRGRLRWIYKPLFVHCLFKRVRTVM